MKELCKRCKHFDGNTVYGVFYYCHIVNMTIWFDLDVYAGCGGFEEKDKK